MRPEELPEAKSNKPGWIRSVLCIAIAILGAAYALGLRVYGFIGTEVALFGFTCLFIFVAIVVYVLPQLQELNLKELKVVFREIKETENRIYATEQTVRELLLTLADLAVMETLNFSRLSGSEFGDLMRKWRDKRVDKILELVEATPEQKSHLRRYVPMYKGMDDAHAIVIRIGIFVFRKKSRRLHPAGLALAIGKKSRPHLRARRPLDGSGFAAPIVRGSAPS